MDNDPQYLILQLMREYYYMTKAMLETPPSQFSEDAIASINNLQALVKTNVIDQFEESEKPNKT